VIRLKLVQGSSANRSVVDAATMGCGNSKNHSMQPQAVNDEHAKKTFPRTSTILLGDGVQQAAPGNSVGADQKTHAESSQSKAARIASFKAQLGEVHTYYKDQSPAQSWAPNRKQGRKATPWAKPSDMDVEDDDEEDDEEHEEDQQQQQQTDNKVDIVGEKRVVVSDQVEEITIPHDELLRVPMRPMSPKVNDVEEDEVDLLIMASNADLVAASRIKQRKSTPWVQLPEETYPLGESIQVVETRQNWWQSCGFCQ